MNIEYITYTNEQSYMALKSFPQQKLKATQLIYRMAVFNTGLWKYAAIGMLWMHKICLKMYTQYGEINFTSY